MINEIELTDVLLLHLKQSKAAEKRLKRDLNQVEEKATRSPPPLIGVISLRTMPGRFQDICERSAPQTLSFVRLIAIDEQAILEHGFSDLIDKKAYERHTGRPSKISEFGCYLSHLACWHLTRKLVAQSLFILEDDIYVRSGIDLSQLFAGFSLSQIQDKPIMIKMFGKYPRQLKLTDSPWDEFDKSGSLDLYSININLPAAGAYYVNALYAQRLVQDALPITRPLDHYAFRPWHFAASVHMIYPCPVTFYKGNVSRIGGRAKKWPWYRRWGHAWSQAIEMSRQGMHILKTRFLLKKVEQN